MSTFPTWDRKRDYLAEAQAAMTQVAADVDADSTNVWQSIDAAIAALHKLRSASGTEYIRRHDAMVARMEAEDAARRSRPADPTPEVVAEVRQLVAQGHGVLARLALLRHTSMTLPQAREFVELVAFNLASGEGVAR